ncbi:MAG: alanine--tRNA ligase [Bacteroidota bacterium]
MDSQTVRRTFLDFFASKTHQIVASAPMVIKNDPTLMFTNAGMNQFKDIFLGNTQAKYARIADTQKCLRVSGKHNDLEEVGHDTYHHTMFEMLGNWSFGDYFKKEAIEWAWELLTEVYKINKDNLYVTVFGGDEKEGLEPDNEAFEFWSKIISKDRIIYGSKKDNFWEMGDTGPCGPCSEIHVDIRDEAAKKLIPGKELVNQSDPHVIEIWNLVFIEFNRKSDNSLSPLPAKHIDTGMGFERLCMVMQGVKSNYDTDVFQPVIRELAKIAGKTYGEETKTDVAMRVIADHLRAVSFAIADGQLPSNNKAGYVIRRILRRAVRYGYTFLGFSEPFMFRLVPLLALQMGEAFPELESQKDLVMKVMQEEEQAFLRTLSVGLQKFEHYKPAKNIVEGAFAFELFDTFGFPIDLTQLIAREKGFDVDMPAFAACMEEQKKRSRQAATVDKEDWTELIAGDETEFLGYDTLETSSRIAKFRKVKAKDKEFFQVVLDKTPFYAESGGQAGDKGLFLIGDEKIGVDNTIKENNLIIHLVKKLPSDTAKEIIARVDPSKRNMTANNHSATHLLHSALKMVLGTHVEQKGSMVDDERLRFDFSHFAKMSDEEIRQVEAIVNQKIRENIVLTEMRNLPMKEAQELGAVALFGEKYGDNVRVIVFDKAFSMELCGGTHVKATGQIGLFRIVSESAIAAGVRRIEAITSAKAEAWINEQLEQLAKIKAVLKGSQDPASAIESLLGQNADLQKKIEQFQKEKASGLKQELIAKISVVNGLNFIAEKVDLDAAVIKNLAFELKADVENLFLVLGAEAEGKANLTIIMSEHLVKDRGLNASKIIRELGKEIQGGGGGQDYYATAGGKNPAGLESALKKAVEFIS